MNHANCASVSGPVFTAAMRALDEGDVTIALPYVPQSREAELCAAFDAVMPLLDESSAVRAVANLHFAETVVRLHRTGHGASYYGVEVGRTEANDIVDAAADAVVTGSTYELFELLSATLTSELHARINAVRALAERSTDSVAAQRRYVEAALGFSGWAQHVHDVLRDD